MIGGLCVWLLTATASSFVTKSYFWVLVLMRALVGTGEASYTTVAPTIIADLFTGTRRSVMISAFYIFIPVGSGLGYISGSSLAALTGNWQWALRLTPIMGVLGLVLLIFFCPNPPRGAAETHGTGVTEPSSYLDDVKYLVKNKSFVWSTLGVTSMAFLTGAFAFWMPTFLYRAQVYQGHQQACNTQICENKHSYIFGAVTVATGILGVCVGAALSRHFRDKVSNADPVICAVGMLGSVPCLLIILFVAQTSIPVTYVFIFLGETLLSLNWPILADILLYVVIPTRRATAEALQISVGHLLGDAGSPYLVGVISDALSTYHPESNDWSFHSLKYSLLLCPFVGILGAVFFLMTSLYITEDRRVAQQLCEGDPHVHGAVPTLELGTEEKEGNAVATSSLEENL
ncbi:protein spinster homolog 3 isoform X2 [Genypterus blacodes]